VGYDCKQAVEEFNYMPFGPDYFLRMVR
jgi:hypothetical protein